ncbi:hypothetical protein [Microbacterium sp. SS28]|uniref:hypothetical protein n=1 Tax=Microbacterium sp. SS28 TaxID=2919948 RepID=UPI001FAAA186|nr:hypothetical protein [Microbacterium sp. SS28]
MSEPMIDDLLARSAPPSRAWEPGVQARLDALVVEARGRARATRRRKTLAWAMTPLALAPALALATTGGTDPRMVPDLVIPVTYTTDTGRTVSCSLEFFNGELDYVEVSTAAVDHLRTLDWTGIGQRLYDTALRYEAAGDSFPWSSAENDLITATIPGELLTADTGGMGGDSDCTGELH